MRQTYQRTAVYWHLRESGRAILQTVAVLQQRERRKVTYVDGSYILISESYDIVYTPASLTRVGWSGCEGAFAKLGADAVEEEPYI